MAETDEQLFYKHKKAAEEGNADSQLELGFYYAEGKIVNQDYKKAVYWFQKAADQNEILAKVFK